MTVESLELIIARERPDVILPTLGGQTALNLTIALGDAGVLERYPRRPDRRAARLDPQAEDRDRFRAAMQKIGLKLPKSGYARSVEDAQQIVTDTGLPAIIRPSFTLGGTGGGIARSPRSCVRSSSGRSTSLRTKPAWSSRACSAGRNSSSR